VRRAQESASLSPLTTESSALKLLTAYRLIVPVEGVRRASLRDNFSETRGDTKHEAIDIAAARGTPVVAAGDGRVVKLFNSRPGASRSISSTPQIRFAYYYAHLDRYASGLREGHLVKRGDTLGYVGTSGNAPPQAPHPALRDFPPRRRSALVAGVPDQSLTPISTTPTELCGRGRNGCVDPSVQSLPPCKYGAASFK
jgi:murein DD-endopeptidase MepM/ murein hydrolase activator NlpD